jgi:uncharacterized lipoprotein YajG
MLSEKNEQSKNLVTLTKIEMKKLITILAATIFFSSCQKDSNDNPKDELVTQEKIIIPKETTTVGRSEDDQYNTFTDRQYNLAKGMSAVGSISLTMTNPSPLGWNLQMGS